MSETCEKVLASEEASLQLHESGAAILYLCRNSSEPVTLTLPRMESIARLLKQVKEEKPAALVITSEGSGGFCAGLDNKVKASFTSAIEAETLALSGQELCHAIETLPFPSVAAIQGACLAEGFEIALACTYRIMSKDAQSFVGLPHVKLGVIPAFGTLRRLPKILGLRKALNIVLAGRMLKSGEAFSTQLVHELAPPQALLDQAMKLAAGAYIPRKIKVSLFDSLVAQNKHLRRKLRKNVLEQIRINAKDNAESSHAAVASIFASVEQPTNWRSNRDASEFGRLAVSNESKALLRVAELKDSARKLGSMAQKEVEHVHAVVLGAGHMGAGITAALAANECSVILKDIQEQHLRRGLQQIKKHVAKIEGLNEAEKSFIINRIEMTTRNSANFGNTNIAIEAVQEDKAVRQKVIAELCGAIPEEAIIASSASSYSISELAKNLKHPARLIGMHFFFPAEKHALVEIVMGSQTSNRAIAIASAVACKMGKCPIVVHDVAGFLVNRILNPYFREAFQLFQEGYSVADIDYAAQHFGFSMGPFRFLDENGLDIAAQWMDSIDREHGEELKGLNFCKTLAQAGRKGHKTGAGFYHYGRRDISPSPDLRALLHITATERPLAEEQQALTERLVSVLLNEAVKCLDQGIAGKAGPEAAKQIDLGVVLGGDFPASKGGPLYYIDTIGAETLLEMLKGLELKHGSRFRPAEGIARRAQRKEALTS